MPRDDLSTPEGIRNARIRLRAEQVLAEIKEPTAARSAHRTLVALMDDVHNRAVEMVRDDSQWGDEPPVWCKTCQHVHIPSIPVRTFRCSDEDRCGFGSWSPRIAQQHATKEHHHVLPIVHRVRPLTDDERAAWAIERATVLQEQTTSDLTPPPGPSMASLIAMMKGEDE